MMCPSKYGTAVYDARRMMAYVPGVRYDLIDQCGDAMIDPRSIERRDASDVVIFPNPAESILYIRSDQMQENDMIKIFSSSGRLLIKQTVHSGEEQIAVEHFENGLYILVIEHQHNGSKTYRKFIK